MIKMGDSSIVYVDVIAKKPTTLSISVYPTSGKPPLTVTITGTLKYSATPISGREIRLRVNGVFDPYASATTDAYGNYQIIYALYDVGTYNFQTNFAGDDEYEGCERSNGATVIGEAPTINPLIPLAIAGTALVGIVLWLAKKR